MKNKVGSSSDARSNVLGQFRGAFYLLFSRAFSREPDREMLGQFDKVFGGLMEAWELMEVGSDPDVQAGRVLLEEFFAGLRQMDPDEAIQQMAREYASLFLGVGPKTVSLCESAYRSATGLLYQSTLFDVQQSYRETGMAKNAQYHEPDDHLAIELGYMARLCRIIAEPDSGEREQALGYTRLQQRFMENHLAQWIPQFSEDLIVKAPCGFYQAIAHVLRGYISIDSRLIEMLIQELNPDHRAKAGKAERG